MPPAAVAAGEREISIMDSQAIFSMMSGIMNEGAASAAVMVTLLMLIGVLLVWMEL